MNVSFNVPEPSTMRKYILCVLFSCSSVFANAESLVFEGESGPGAGKHIVFLAGDNAYRSEESLPAKPEIEFLQR
jgi:hypothetical protein